MRIGQKIQAVLWQDHPTLTSDTPLWSLFRPGLLIAHSTLAIVFERTLTEYWGFTRLTLAVFNREPRLPRVNNAVSSWAEQSEIF